MVVGLPAAVAGPNRELSIRTRLYWPTHFTISPPAVSSYGALTDRTMFVPAFGVSLPPCPMVIPRIVMFDLPVKSTLVAEVIVGPV